MAIRPLDFQSIDDNLKGVLQPIVDRLGYFGDFFRYASHAPGVLTEFMQMSGALKAALPDDVNEAIALTVCTALDFPYERIQHERLSEKLGFKREWIAHLTGVGPSVPLSPLQEAGRTMALAVVESRYEEARTAAEQAADLADQTTAVAMLFQATRFVQVCTIGRTLQMTIGVGSIFERGDGS